MSLLLLNAGFSTLKGTRREAAQCRIGRASAFSPHSSYHFSPAPTQGTDDS